MIARMKRALLHLASLYPGVSLGLVVPARPDDAPPAKALAISSTDLALSKAIQRHMAGLGAASGYEHMVLTGAPLQALGPGFPQWNDLFQDHVELVTRPRGIKHVLLVEKARDSAPHLRRLGEGIRARNAALRIDTLLMGDDGELRPLEAA